MALTQTTTAPVSLQTSFNNPKQIAVYADIVSTVMYTVPAGKKFNGYVHGPAVLTNYSVTPSGGAVAGRVAAAISTTPMELIFVAGTIITNTGGSGTYVIGVETDA